VNLPLSGNNFDAKVDNADLGILLANLGPVPELNCISHQRISIMKNLSTGTGLCIAGLCVVAFPFAQKLASVESQAHAGVQASAMTAVASSATAQVTPTIVWYGVVPTLGTSDHKDVFRAWSDGRIEATRGRFENTGLPGSYCTKWVTSSGSSSSPLCSPWTVVSDPSQGYNAASDINFDSRVDGSDLGQLLAAWGDAPRQDIPPSDCPLNLVNP
jgi:hypothetical protein